MNEKRHRSPYFDLANTYCSVSKVFMHKLALAGQFMVLKTLYIQKGRERSTDGAKLLDEPPLRDAGKVLGNSHGGILKPH